MTTVTVEELARQLGWTNDEVRSRLAALGHPLAPPDASVSEEAADKLVGAAHAEKPTGLGGADDVGGRGKGAAEELRELVLAAFATARQSKPESWTTMTTAVLKNRLLQQTGDTFSERAYGFRNMTELAHSLADLVVVNEEARPVALTLRASPETTVVEASPLQSVGPGTKVRPDLWDAVMDFSASHAWVWVNGRAEPGEASTGLPVLPTLSPFELQDWRDAFAAKYAESLDEESSAALAAWRAAGRGTRYLPAKLRPLWNEWMKGRAVELLRAWFQARQEEPPSNLILDLPNPSHATGPAGRPTTSGSVRAFVASVVAIMTEAELQSLSLPAAAVHRWAERRGEVR